MVCFMNVLVILLVVVGIIVRCDKELEIDRDDNIEPFSLLCRIYNVAKNPPINYVDLQETFEIVDKINALNASSMDQKRLNETEEMWSSVGAKLIPTVTPEATLAQLSLNRITQRAHKILDEMKKLNIDKEIEKAKADFSQVIFGESGNESDLDLGALKGVIDRAKACGNTGLSHKGTSAGNNLVVDFFCLCTQRPDGSEGAKQVCGFYVGSNYPNGVLGWNESHPMGSSTMWASIKGGCGKHMQQHPKSTSEAHHIIDQFLKHLKTGGVYRQIKCEPNCPPPSKRNVIIVSGSGRKEGMLGTGITINSSTEVTCDGKKGGKESNNAVQPGGVCVYYGEQSQWDNIPWLKQFKTALVSVGKTNKQTVTIQRDIKKLQMLLHRAEEIYETTKVILKIQNHEELTAFQNETGSLATYNATRTRSYSHRSHTHFIPLCVLLLL